MYLKYFIVLLILTWSSDGEAIKQKKNKSKITKWSKVLYTSSKRKEYYQHPNVSNFKTVFA